MSMLRATLMVRPFPLTAATVAAVLCVVACSSTSAPADAGTDTEAGASLHWYKTCGAPVCPVNDAGASADAGVVACTVENAGVPCAASGATCDPGIGCDVRLLCTARDPRAQPGGCPISRRAYKTDVSYLDAAGVDRLADQVRKLRLATYRYRDAPDRLRLGFMIDDVPECIAVDQPRDQIDLYSYVSMAVGALQAESAHIDALEHELAALRRQIATQRSPHRRRK